MKEFAEKHLMFNKLNEFQINFQNLFYLIQIKITFKTLHKYNDIICISTISCSFLIKNAKDINYNYELLCIFHV